MYSLSKQKVQWNFQIRWRTNGNSESVTVKNALIWNYEEVMPLEEIGSHVEVLSVEYICTSSIALFVVKYIIYVYHPCHWYVICIINLKVNK